MNHTTTTDPLVERYVAAVAARLPADQRQDVADELRATVLDTVEDRLDEGPAPDRDRVVRDVLTDLGDPAVLARGYAARPRHLVGPEHYDAWWGLLVTIVLVAAPVTALITLVARIWAEDPVVPAVLGAVWTGITVAIHVAFWVTLVFWILERTGADTGDDEGAWSPDDLPELPRRRTLGLTELLGGVGFLAIVLAWLPWQHYRSPVDDPTGERVPLLDPALWSGWLWGFVAVLVLGIVVEVVKYAAGRWTLGVTVLAVLTDVATAAFLAAMVSTQTVVNPALEADGIVTATADNVVLVVAIIVGTLGVAEAVRGHLRERRSVDAVS